MIGEKVDYVGYALSKITEEYNNALREIEQNFDELVKQAKKRVREAVERIELKLDNKS